MQSASLKEELERAAELFNDCGRLTILTGAGVSKESGIPTFRDALEGLWANYNPEDLATPQGFMKDPPLVWKWYDSRRRKLEEVKPNPGHFAIVELEKLCDSVVVVTQNIDGLHHQAGSQDVIELHGSIARFHCFDNQHEAEEVPFGLSEPPTCSRCDSLVRPAVVWFGEMLPGDALSRAMRECEQADLLLVVGTSGLVQPAASLPMAGLMGGARVIEVNPETTPITNAAEIFLEGPSGEVLPQLVNAIQIRRKP